MLLPGDHFDGQGVQEFAAAALMMVRMLRSWTRSRTWVRGGFARRRWS